MEQEIELPCEMTDEQKEAYEELCLGNDKDAIDAYISICGKKHLDDALENFEEAYAGEFRSDEDFAENLAEDLGELPKENHWPHYCIDWEFAAREIMMDYIEEDNYYFRNI